MARITDLLRGAAGVARLVRPLNVVLMAAGAAVGALLVGGGLAGPVLLAMASAALIGAAANSINDVYDLPIDRVNRPGRPLPSGQISVGAARSAAVAGAALGVGLAALISPPHLAIAAASVGLLWGYSARLKRMPFVGNLAVALVVGAALPFGGAAALEAAGAHGGLGPAMLGGAFAFGSTLAREVAKDIEDAAGDAAVGARTLPLVTGVPTAAAVAAAATVATVAVIPLAPAFGLGPTFLALGLPVAALLLAAAWAVLAADDAPRSAARASGLLKAAMAVGLVALAVV